MRVIAGKYKRRMLKTVDSRLTRPTTDKNKENLFNLIGPYFDGGICLDLFSGSGGLAIEALSRGVDQIYCVDKQYKAFATIQQNVKSLQVEDVSHIYKMDYQKALQLFADKKLQFDLVFLDPPYSMKINQTIIQFMVKHQMLSDGSVIVIEDLNEEAFEITKPFQLKKQQSYGITTLQIIEYKE